MKNKLLLILGISLTLFVFTFGKPVKADAAIAFRASATTSMPGATSITINVPTGTTIGDIEVAGIYANGNQAAVLGITPPAGWTLAQKTDNVSGSYYPAVALYYHTVTTTEPANYTWTFSNYLTAAYGGGWIASFSGANGGVDLSGSQNVGSSGVTTTSYSTPSITTTAANDMLVMVYAGNCAGTTWGTPTGATAITSGVGGGCTGGSGYYKAQAAAGASGAITSTAGTASYGGAAVIALKSVSAAATTTGNGGYSYNYFYSAGTVTNNTGSTAWYGTAWGAGAGYSGTACSALPNKTDYSTIATGTSNQAISAYVTASPSTVYYFCVYVKDSVNTYYYSSTTATVTTSATPAPAVSIYAAHTIDNTSAIIGSGTNAYGLSATGFFRYGTSNLACSSLATTTTSGSAGSLNGTYYPNAVQLTGLLAGTTYYYCYQATTTAGTTYSAVTSFATAATASTGCDLLPSSTLASAADKTTIAGYMLSSKFAGTRVYQATVNGWTASAFHTAANAQGATIILYKNGNNNKIFGAYNPQSWSSAGTYNAGAGGFLFSLSDGYKLAQTNYADYQSYNNGSYGPTFGGGHDIGMNNATLNTQSGDYTSTHSYENPSSKGAFTYLDGGGGTPSAYNFLPTEIEVYKLSTCIQNAPTVTTPTKTSISYTTATLGGNVTTDGGVTITGRGVCVGPSANPAVGGTCFTTTGTTGVFTVSATGLTQNTLYHYRAYATNSVGTSYTTDDTFTTLTQLATVTTSAPSNIDTTSVNFVMSANPNSFGASTGYFRYAAGATVACDGSAGTRWPTAGGISIPDGAGAQTYTQTTSPTLNPSTQYAYCAYDLNAYGTASAASSQTFTTPSWTAGCAAPTTGNLTVSSSCYFSNSNDGVDAGGTTASTLGNTATLTVSTGKTLNVGTAVPNQKVAFGVLSKPAGAVIARALGAQLMRSPVWVLDTDGDGYPDAANPAGVVSATRPGATYARRSFINTNIASADCNVSNANVFQNVANLATDGDNDGYISGSTFGTQCAGTTSTVNGRTYYKGTAGTYTFLTSGAQLGTSDCNDANATVYRNGYTDADADTYATSATPTCIGASTTGYSLSPSGYSDCNDANANIFQNVSVATDGDQDGYATSTASSQCVGPSTVVSGRTYYRGSGGTYIMLVSGGQLGTSDCCDSANNTYPGSSTCRPDTNACGSRDYNCTGTTTQDCTGTYSLAPGTATQATTSCTYSGACGTAQNASCGLPGYYYACH